MSNKERFMRKKLIREELNDLSTNNSERYQKIIGQRAEKNPEFQNELLEFNKATDYKYALKKTRQAKAKGDNNPESIHKD